MCKIRSIVVYDSFSGNTKKIAEAIASVYNCDIKKVDEAPLDLKNYDILILGTLNIRAHPSDKIINYINNLTVPKYFSLFVTFGMPIWGQISSIFCLRKMRKLFEAKGSKFIKSFICPGFHIKYKTYKGRPSCKDLEAAKRFATKIYLRSGKIL
ncbi:MAG: hypothetical protein NC935_03445 [Candidatus Omnitrophica bacterium]|nr:hypothetical protein [Candidatus Omnitrophota bacterium]